MRLHSARVLRQASCGCIFSLPAPRLVQRMRRDHKAAIDAAVEERIVTALVGEHAGEDTKRSFRSLYRCVAGVAAAANNASEGLSAPGTLLSL